MIKVKHFHGRFLANRLRWMPYGRGVLRTEALLAEADVFREMVLMSSRYFPTLGRIEQEVLFGRRAAFNRGHPLNDIRETKGRAITTTFCSAKIQ